MSLETHGALAQRTSDRLVDAHQRALEIVLRRVDTVDRRLRWHGCGSSSTASDARLLPGREAAGSPCARARRTEPGQRFRPRGAPRAVAFSRKLGLRCRRARARPRLQARCRSPGTSGCACSRASRGEGVHPLGVLTAFQVRRRLERASQAAVGTQAGLLRPARRSTELEHALSPDVSSLATRWRRSSGSSRCWRARGSGSACRGGARRCGCRAARVPSVASAGTLLKEDFE